VLMMHVLGVHRYNMRQGHGVDRSGYPGQPKNQNRWNYIWWNGYESWR